MMTKKCTKCGEVKAFDEYCKDKNSKDGLRGNCKSCAKAYRKQYRQDNKEKLAKYQKQHRQDNREKIAKRQKQYSQDNKEKIAKRMKRYRQANKGELAKYNKQYRQDNKEKIAKRRNKHAKKRKANDPVFKMICNLRTGLWAAMSGTRKPKKTMELLGCSKEHLEHHLSAQFTDGMTLENYGEWQIDHIQPVDSFDHNEPEQVAICWHYTNLQPMWAKDNKRKSNKIISEHQVNLL
jgi:phage-related minor tail protein